MKVPHLDFLKSAPPAPRVVLLPDACFFTRTILLDEGCTEEQLITQVDLALEGMSPFPFSQLYRGHYWVPGTREVLVFAAYRRRFTQDQIHSWSGAEWVAPSFCALLNQEPKTSRVIVYNKDEALTAIQWSGSRVPSRILVKPLPADATPEQVAQIREILLGELGPVSDLQDLEAAPAAGSSGDERNFVFLTGDKHYEIPISSAASMDVRSQEDLLSLRKAKQRDTMLWRSALGLTLALLVLGLGEIALGAGWAWQKTRKTQVQLQQTVVDKIMTAQLLASRIDELATKRLLPFEMITLLAEKKPRSIQFVRTTTDGLLKIQVEATTANASDLVAWETSLTGHPAISSIEITDRKTRDNVTRFTLVANFKQEGLKAE
jgi:hypothetical protein